MRGDRREKSRKGSAPGDPVLVRSARTARARAYAPYSRFRVGAAVRAHGRVFLGANVENASYGLTLCAERAAVAAAVLAGARRLEALAVASSTSPPTPPCGMCLQALSEFAGPDLKVFLAGGGGRVLTATLGELLPRGFTSRFL